LAEAWPLTPKHLVGEVLDRHPQLLPTFVAFGFRPLLNPVMQRTLTRHVTIGQACRVAGVDSESLLTALNDKLTQEADGDETCSSSPRALSVVEIPASVAHAVCSCCEEHSATVPVPR
jgi:hypothetical protein